MGRSIDVHGECLLHELPSALSLGRHRLGRDVDPAVDVENRTRDVEGFRAAEEGHRLGDLFGLGQTTERQRLAALTHVFLGKEAAFAWRVRPPRVHRVDANTVAGQFLGKDPGEVIAGGLAHAVGGILYQPVRHDAG